LKFLKDLNVDLTKFSRPYNDGWMDGLIDLWQQAKKSQSVLLVSLKMSHIFACYNPLWKYCHKSYSFFQFSNWARCE